MLNLEARSKSEVGGQAGLRKTNRYDNSLAHRTTWLRSDFAGMVAGVIVNRTQQEIPNEATMKATEEAAVATVVEAARILLEK